MDNLVYCFRQPSCLLYPRNPRNPRMIIMSLDAMPDSLFTEHTVESAPPAARRFLTATRDHLGYLPAGMARMAASPQLMDGFLRLTAIFENTTLEPVARAVVVM